MHAWDWVIKTCVELKRTWSWQQSIVENPQKDLSVAMRLKTFVERDLCVLEKVSIICADANTLLNKRTKLISKCRHRNKFLVAHVKKNCHGMVFNCLPQLLYKETKQNWHILCCSFLWETRDSSLLTISIINWDSRVSFTKLK